MAAVRVVVRRRHRQRASSATRCAASSRTAERGAGSSAWPRATRSAARRALRSTLASPAGPGLAGPCQQRGRLGQTTSRVSVREVNRVQVARTASRPGRALDPGHEPGRARAVHPRPDQPAGHRPGVEGRLATSIPRRCACTGCSPDGAELQYDAPLSGIDRGATGPDREHRVPDRSSPRTTGWSRSTTGSVLIPESTGYGPTVLRPGAAATDRAAQAAARRRHRSRSSSRSCAITGALDLARTDDSTATAHLPLAGGRAGLAPAAAVRLLRRARGARTTRPAAVALKLRGMRCLESDRRDRPARRPRRARSGPSRAEPAIAPPPACVPDPCLCDRPRARHRRTVPSGRRSAAVFTDAQVYQVQAAARRPVRTAALPVRAARSAVRVGD